MIVIAIVIPGGTCQPPVRDRKVGIVDLRTGKGKKCSWGGGGETQGDCGADVSRLETFVFIDKFCNNCKYFLKIACNYYTLISIS